MNSLNINQIIGILSRTHELRTNPTTRRRYTDFQQYKEVCKILMSRGASKIALNSSAVKMEAYILENQHLVNAQEGIEKKDEEKTPQQPAPLALVVPVKRDRLVLVRPNSFKSATALRRRFASLGLVAA